MVEDVFRIGVEGGELVGDRGGQGPPALVLHGGPAVSDYTAGLAAELGSLFSTFRYTQRGVAPSTVGAPFTIESHASDAIAVLDHFGVERAWVVGHSWGGHLALHLAVSHPDRLRGVIGINPLGAFGDVFGEMGEKLRRGLTDEERQRVDEVEDLRRAGTATEDDLRERFALVWPQYFADPSSAPSVPLRVGRDCSRDTNASIAEHFERGTLVHGLPAVRLPALFVHGELDPLPLSSVERTAALVPRARLEVISGCGHFPWWEARGETGRIVAEFVKRG